MNDILSNLLTILSIGAAARLLQQRLFLKLPFLALGSMLLLSAVRDLVLLAVPYESHLYAVLWEWTLPPLLLAHSWAAFSAYQRLTGLYPKLGDFVSGLLATCLAAAVIICCVLTPFETPRIGGNELILRTMFLLYRWVDTICAGALLLAVVFFSRLPSPLKRPPRNVLLHAVLLALYLSAHAITCFAENLAPLGASELIENLYFVSASALCAVWICAMRAEGEESVRWPLLNAAIATRIDSYYYAALSRFRSSVR